MAYAPISEASWECRKKEPKWRVIYYGVRDRLYLATSNKFSRTHGAVVKLCIFAVILLIFNLIFTHVRFFGGGAKKQPGILPYFPKAHGKGSQVTWAHALNSNNLLDDALKGTAMMLEADVSPHPVYGASVPIMAHPPTTESDITLEEWVSKAKGHDKGIKMDIKFNSVVEPTLKILNRHRHQLKFPVILNADILPGPTDPMSLPMDPRQFIKLCQMLYPNSTLSLGWTTYVDNGISHQTYNSPMIQEMVRLVRDMRVTQPLTFPIRACFAKNSVPQMKELLRLVPDSSLNVWSSLGDPVTSQELVTFHQQFDPAVVYYDLPSPLKEEFQHGLENLAAKR